RRAPSAAPSPAAGAPRRRACASRRRPERWRRHAAAIRRVAARCDRSAPPVAASSSRCPWPYRVCAPSPAPRAEVAAARAASAPERCFMTGNRNWSSSWLHADGPVQANGLAVEHFVFEDLSHERCIFVRPAEALRKRHLPAEGLLHLG